MAGKSVPSTCAIMMTLHGVPSASGASGAGR